MRVQSQASPHEVIGLGVAFSAAGLYFMLGASGYLPMPEANGPAFIVFCAGLAFLLAGLTCVVRARTGVAGLELSDPAPSWSEISYRIFAIGVAGALAIIGTFIALGSGPRAFSVSGSLVGLQTAGEALGRTMFGLGAVIAWIYAIALTIAVVRKILNRAG